MPGENWVAEYKFAHGRGWRLDFALPDRMLGIEVDGGVWTGGRHTSGAGFIADQHKLNCALMHGWRVFRTTPSGLPALCHAIARWLECDCELTPNLEAVFFPLR